MADWSDQMIIDVRRLWAEGHSTAEIARRMGVSKNAVVGKAHRLDLPTRPSPIRRYEDSEVTPAISARRAAAAAHRIRKLGLPTLATLQSVSDLADEFPDPPPALVRRPPPPQPKPERVLAPRPILPLTGKVSDCCWPINNSVRFKTVFCDKPTLPGRVYCEDHAKIAFVKARDRREDHLTDSAAD